MGEAYIVRRGGDGLNSYAFITAEIPADSSANCTKIVSGVTHTAQKVILDAAGRHIVFLVPSSGTWTITVSQLPSVGSLSITKDVSITAQGQAENITIKYDIVIPLTSSGWAYVKGTQQTANVTNRTADNALGFYSSASNTRLYYNTAIDITHYKKIVLSYEANHGVSSTLLGIGQGTIATGQAFLKSWNPSATGTYTDVEIDISGVDISDAKIMWTGTSSSSVYDYLVSAKITI